MEKGFRKTNLTRNEEKTVEKGEWKVVIEQPKSEEVVDREKDRQKKQRKTLENQISPEAEWTK